MLRRGRAPQGSWRLSVDGKSCLKCRNVIFGVLILRGNSLAVPRIFYAWIMYLLNTHVNLSLVRIRIVSSGNKIS